MIALEWNNLEGTISEAIGMLPELRVLNLGTNSVTGELPASIGECTKLRVLKLSYNRMEGKWPAGLLRARNLEMIDVPYNDFVADLNAMIVAYPKLRVLNARGNRGFGGDLGARRVRRALARMQHLETLDLHWNNVGGSLPRELFAIPTLEEVHISNNQLVGALPAFACPKLRVLSLFNNYLDGELPPSLGRMAALEELQLHQNMISGAVPSTFEGLAAAKTVNLRWNLLSGGVPRELFRLPAVEEIDLSNNPLGGSLPADVGAPGARLTKLGLHSCRLTGTLPAEIGSLSSLKTLDAYNNRISGEVPASVGGLAALERLSLRGNRLSGALPETLGLLRELRELHLHNNRLERLPESVGDLHNLRELLVQDNRLGGTFPEVLGYLSGLRRLSLHNNLLEGGGLPESLSNLVELDEFTAHDNLIAGDPWPRIDPGIDDRTPFRPETYRPFCEDLRNRTSGGLTHSYFRTCGTRNDFYVDVLLRDRRHEWRETHGENWMVGYGKCKPTPRYDTHSSFQRSSRFADMREVADKSKFAAYMKRQQRLQGDAFDFHPPTFRMPFDKAAWKKEAAKQPDGYWLLKPSISCCGQKIRLVTGPDDPSFPEDEGNWIIQRFVHPPYLVKNHKFVLRLFAIVTSMSPLRVYLFPDGDVFYTHAEYDVNAESVERANLRGFFITDYFFTKKQRQLYTSSNQLFDYLKSTGVDTDKVFNDVRDVIVKSLQVSEPQYRMAQDETIAYPESTYEVLGWDILLDEDLKPHVCEVNTTPNMGLEINRGNDPVVHEEDFELKTEIMRHVLEITGTLGVDNPKAGDQECGAIVHSKLAEVGRAVNDTHLAWCPEDELAFECLTSEDVALLVEYECELQRRGGFVPMFPGTNAEELVALFPVHRRENHLQVWWMRLRDPDPEPEYPTPWSTPTRRPWREDPDFNWHEHVWTPNTPGNRWNTEEDGEFPEENAVHESYLDDGDAFNDPEPEVIGKMDAILANHEYASIAGGGGAAAGGGEDDDEGGFYAAAGGDGALAAGGDDDVPFDDDVTSEILAELESIDWNTVDYDTFDWDRYGLKDPRLMSEAEMDELLKDDPEYQKTKAAYDSGDLLPPDDGDEFAYGGHDDL